MVLIKSFMILLIQTEVWEICVGMDFRVKDHGGDWNIKLGQTKFIGIGSLRWHLTQVKSLF